MSVQIVNGHVLFPHVVNFDQDVRWQRRWQNEVDGSEFGQESRYCLRALPLVSLQWKLTAADLQEDAQLLDRLMAAIKSGLACAPHWGRSTTSDLASSASAIVIAPTLWPFSSGGFVFLQDAAGRYEVAAVQSFAANTLTFTSPLSYSYPAGCLLWPLLFGKFEGQNFEAIDSGIGEATVGLAELEPANAATIGSADPPIDGIGGWIIGGTFIVQ